MRKWPRGVDFVETSAYKLDYIQTARVFHSVCSPHIQILSKQIAVTDRFLPIQQFFKDVTENKVVFPIMLPTFETRELFSFDIRILLDK